MEETFDNGEIPSEELEVINSRVKSISRNYLRIKRRRHLNSKNPARKTANLLSIVRIEGQCEAFEHFINLSASKSGIFQDDVSSLTENARSKEVLKHVESLIEIEFKELQSREAILDITIPIGTIFLTFLAGYTLGNILNAATATAVAIGLFKVIFEFYKQSERSMFNYVLIALKRAQEKK